MRDLFIHSFIFSMRTTKERKALTLPVSYNYSIYFATTTNVTVVVVVICSNYNSILLLATIICLHV